MRNVLRSYKRFLFTLLMFIIACEDDEGFEVVDESAPSEVPGGRIVPQEERAFVITGFAEGSSDDYDRPIKKK